MIEVQNLTKRYGPVTAVSDVSFRVEAGEILGFLGPNGAGKTTTMRIITGYMPATEGKVVVAGYDVFDKPIEAKRRTGYLPETPPLYPDMTVREYLQFVARIKGVPRPRRQCARRRGRWKTARVADMAARHCAKLSKGYRQRVGLAQAIIHNPDVLDPRRADRRARPEAAGRDAGADSRPGWRPHHRPQLAHPLGSRGDLPARRHHQQGPRRCRRHAGQSDDAAEGVGHACTCRWRGPAGDVQAAMAGLAGVTSVGITPKARWHARRRSRQRTQSRHPPRAGGTVVGRGWGLLELRPMRMGLEDIYLKLTEDDAAASGAAVAADDRRRAAGGRPCVTSWPLPARSCAATSRRRLPSSARLLRARLRLVLLRAAGVLQPAEHADAGRHGRRP